MDADQCQGAGGEDEGDAENAGAVAAEESRENAEGEWGEPADGAPGGGVEAEHLAILAVGGETGEEGSGGGLRGADEEAEDEAEDPEHLRAVDEVEDRGVEDHEQQAGQDDGFGTDAVIEPAADYGADGGDDVGDDTEDEDVAGIEFVDRDGEDGAVGEHTGEAIAEDGGGDEEEDAVAVVLPEAFEVAEEVAVAFGEAIGFAAGGADFGDAEEYREAEEEEPAGGKDGDHADVEAVLGAEFEQAGGAIAIGFNEADIASEQQDDAAEIAHGPAVAGDFADVIWGGDLLEHRVVVDLRELEGQGGDGHDADTEDEPDGGIVAHEVERGHEREGDECPDAHGFAAGAADIGAPAHDGGDAGDGDTGDGHG